MLLIMPTNAAQKIALCLCFAVLFPNTPTSAPLSPKNNVIQVFSLKKVLPNLLRHFEVRTDASVLRPLQALFFAAF